jgi:hypothetical protein
LSCHQYRMIHVPSSMAQSRLDIVHLEIRKFLQDLVGIQAGGKEIEDVNNPNAHTANARAPAALLRVDRDSVGQLGHRASPPLEDLYDYRHKQPTDLPAEPLERDPFSLGWLAQRA